MVLKMVMNEPKPMFSTTPRTPASPLTLPTTITSSTCCQNPHHCDGVSASHAYRIATKTSAQTPIMNVFTCFVELDIGVVCVALATLGIAQDRRTRDRHSFGRMLPSIVSEAWRPPFHQWRTRSRFPHDPCIDTEVFVLHSPQVETCESVVVTSSSNLISYGSVNWAAKSRTPPSLSHAAVPTVAAAGTARTALLNCRPRHCCTGLTHPTATAPHTLSVALDQHRLLDVPSRATLYVYQSLRKHLAGFARLLLLVRFLTLLFLARSSSFAAPRCNCFSAPPRLSFAALLLLAAPFIRAALLP